MPLCTLFHGFFYLYLHSMFLSEDCAVFLQTMVPTIQTFPCHRPPPVSDPLPFGLTEQCIIQREHASFVWPVQHCSSGKIRKAHMLLWDLNVFFLFNIAFLPIPVSVGADVAPVHVPETVSVFPDTNPNITILYFPGYFPILPLTSA